MEISPGSSAHSRSRACEGGEIGALECPQEGANQEAPCDQTCAQQPVPRKTQEEAQKIQSGSIINFISVILLLTLAML